MPIPKAFVGEWKVWGIFCFLNVIFTLMVAGHSATIVFESVHATINWKGECGNEGAGLTFRIKGPSYINIFLGNEMLTRLLLLQLMNEQACVARRLWKQLATR